MDIQELCFDLYFSYGNESTLRPYVSNCPLCRVDFYTSRVANLCEVTSIYISIHPPVGDFYEFTI